LSPRARLWTFGAAAHADADGWEAEVGALAPRPGQLALAPQGGRVVLRSPPELALTARSADRLVLGFGAPAPSAVGRPAPDAPPRLPRRLRVEARSDEAAPWRRLADVADVSTLARAPAGLVVPLVLPAAPAGRGFDRLRIELEFADGATAPLARIAVLPPRN
jgi:hypothetical protein